MQGPLKTFWATAIVLLLCCSQTAAQATAIIGSKDAKDADVQIAVEKQVRQAHSSSSSIHIGAEGADQGLC